MDNRSPRHPEFGCDPASFLGREAIARAGNAAAEAVRSIPGVEAAEFDPATNSIAVRVRPEAYPLVISV